MKIGILTFHETTNFGALLQAVGLQKVLTKLGFDSEIIDYECQNIIDRELPKPITKLIKRFPISLIKRYFVNWKYKNMELFKKENCVLSKRRYNRKTITEANNFYNKFLAGSDMIWNLEVSGEDLTYYLDFVSDKRKKYAFSASFGYDHVPEKYIQTTKTLIKDFRKISIREEQAAEIIKNLTGKIVPVTLDPSLLLTAEEWAKLEVPFKTNCKYVLVYFHDKAGKVLQYARELAAANGWKVFLLGYSLRPIKGVSMLRFVSPGQFLWLVRNASAVVTASYHGLLFSINYNVPFYYFNRTHFGRMETLVKNLTITNRNISENCSGLNEIEWEIVNRHVQDMREKSLQLLQEFMSE